LRLSVEFLTLNAAFLKPSVAFLTLNAAFLKLSVAFRYSKLYL